MKNYSRELDTSTAEDVKVILECDSGHSVSFWVQNTEGTPNQPKGEYGEFAGEECVSRVPLDSYAYRNGGCCYRAAVRTLHGLDIYAD
jgi:hypothetical protein